MLQISQNQDVISFLPGPEGCRRDDRKRAEDRERDDRLRADERARDDRLRTEALQEAERRESAERIAREDREARQVLVTIKKITGDERLKIRHTHEITVSAPHSYPVKQVEVALAYSRNGNMSTSPTGYRGDPPEIDENRIYYRFKAEISQSGETPCVRWVDWHGIRYYQYLHYTERFGQNADWLEAVVSIDRWVRSGQAQARLTENCWSPGHPAPRLRT